MNLTIEDVEKLTTILSLFLVFCGILKIYTYYKVFNLSILPYLKISEIISLFLENVMVFLLVALLVCFLSLDFFYKLKIDGDGFSYLMNLDPLKRITFLLKNLNLSYWIFFTSVFCYYLIYLIREKIKIHEFLFSILLFLIGYFMIPIISIWTKIQFKIYYGLNIKVIYIFFSFLLVSLVLFAIANALNEAFKVKKFGFFLNTVFKFDENETIISNKTIYFIGRTEGYIFFFNTRNKRPIVFPASRLRKNY